MKRQQRIRKPQPALPASEKASLAIRQGGFESVLTQPFAKWNDIELVLGEYLPQWSATHRSFIVQNMIRFLELKILMEDYDPCKTLLAPTKLVSLAWHALILETILYKQVTYAIQEFHGRKRQLIHHSFLKAADEACYEQRLQRTQSLFSCYYFQEMPTSLEEIDMDMSLADTSTLTDLATWAFRGPMGCAQTQSIPKMVDKETKSIKASWISIVARYACFDIVNDALSFGEGEEGSSGSTVLIEDDRTASDDGEVENQTMRDESFGSKEKTKAKSLLNYDSTRKDPKCSSGRK